MKTRFILTCMMYCIIQNIHAQWITMMPSLNNYYGRTNPVGTGTTSIRSIGFGDFSSYPLNATASRFHLTDFGIAYPTNATIPVGSLFRTDGNSANANRWGLWTGNTVGTLSEKFSVSVPAGTSNARLQTTQNGRMFFGTANILRGQINGAQNYAVNGLPGVRDGFWLLTNNPGAASYPGGVTSPLMNNDTYGPYSLLHLVGDASINVQDGGYRNWMRNGITLSNNFDNGFIGVRPMPNTAVPGMDDVSDFVINWSDNMGVLPYDRGPDNLVFTFTNGNGSANDDLSGNSLYGRETMRHTSAGQIGIGPRFSNAFQPQSTLHQHQENAASSWHQISNQYMSSGSATNTGPTTVAPTDGLRLGILGSTSSLQNGIGMLYQQENNHLLFSTNSSTVGVGATNTRERMRITNVGAPTVTPGIPLPGYGLFNPASLGTNITRSSISYDPAQPVNRPTSLLHLGYNAFILSPTVSDGWRPWMDIGTYTASPGDNMYVGLKREGLDHFDAVINWGRNQDSVPNAGPEHLRFIFTSNTVPATNAANTLNGLETGRFYAGRDTLGTYGRFGVGDFTAAGLNQEPTHKIDADGNLRVRKLPDNIYEADASVTKTVMVDNDGVLRWTQNPPSGGGIGNYCTAAPNPLTGNYNIPLNDFNLYNAGQGLPNTNSVGIGYNCGAVLPGKSSTRLNADPFAFAQTPLAVYGEVDSVKTDTSAAAQFINMHDASSAVMRNFSFGSYSMSTAYNTKQNIGVYGKANTVSGDNTSGCYGGYFRAESGGANIGIFASASANPGTNTALAGSFISNASIVPRSTGISASAAGNGNIINSGINANATGTSNINYGLNVSANGATLNYGIFASVPSDGTGGDAAAYINGDFEGIGTNNYISDRSVKQNIAPLENASDLLKQLKPKTYDFNRSLHPQMNLPAVPQMGLISQEVQTVLPNLVKNSVFPAQYDSLGNQLTAQVDYLSLNYMGLIPLLVAGHNELSAKTEKQDSIIKVLNDRLSEMESCLGRLGLCDKSNTPADENDRAANSISVELSDGQSIVLEQNVPNPFAEQTIINYELPQSVVKAQMLFYNAEGKLINTVDLTQRGKGQLNVFASDLSNGVYTYTLVADGQIVATKRMVKN